MVDIAKMLRSEIGRLARKEIRAMVQPLGEQIRDMKKIVRGQNMRIQELEAALATKADQEDAGKIQPALAKEKLTRSIRTSPASIKRHRQRLKLSQREFGLLVGVSTLTVSKWETGNAKPRGKNKETFALLRKMGFKEATARLEQIQGG